MTDELVAQGGLCAPTLWTRPMFRGDIFHVTYRVEGRLRRWRWRRAGWSTEWTVEYVYVPVVDSLPSFTATRGGISYDDV